MTKPERIRPKTEASTIEPPTEWSPHSLYGLKRCNGSDDGRLELLSVIVAWMKQEREWPAKLAVDEIGKALAAGVELYVLNDGDYAKLLPANHSFEYCPVKSFDEIDRTPANENVGLTGAIKHLRLYWSDSRAFGQDKLMGQHVLDALAVRLKDADLLWGNRPHCQDEKMPSIPPASRVSTSADWIGRIQSEATELFIRERAKGRSPTKNSMLPNLRQWCIASGVLMPGTKSCPSEGSIKNRVLNGSLWTSPNVSVQQAKAHVAQVAQRLAQDPAQGQKKT